MGGTKKNVFRISYYPPGQSRLFSEPQVFECRDAGDLQEAVRKAQEKGYDVVSIDYQKEEP